MTRVVILMNGTRKKTYPLVSGVELKDEYWIGGECWKVVATFTTELVDLNAMVSR